jgi:hypothetical protein
MAKKKPAENEHEQYIGDNNSFLSHPNELKFLVTDGTVGIHSDYGVVDIRNGSLKISPSYSSHEFGIGIENRALALSLPENVISIKDGILSASLSLTVEQSNIFKSQTDDNLLSINGGNIFSPSQPMSPGIGEHTLTIRDAAYTERPHMSHIGRNGHKP